MDDQENKMLLALRAGDESAFSSLITRYQDSMIRVATSYVHDRDAAEEVAQEAWLGVLRGLARYEGRSSLRTWIFSILVNQAKTRAERERRVMPFSALSDLDDPAVDPDRFLPADHPRWPRWWAEYPRPWATVPEDHLMTKETFRVIQRAIEDLPPAQRLVLTLRDIEGLTAPEACSVLEISETNQRVLLHRARARVRRALERYFDEEP